LWQEIKRLEREIAELEKRQKEVEEEIYRLMREEDLSRGRIYAREIFSLQQEKLALAVEIDIRKKRRLRLQWEITPC